MHSGLKRIYFNIHEFVFLKIWIHFNPFQIIFICWVSESITIHSHSFKNSTMLRLRSLDCLITFRLHSTNILLVFAEENLSIFVFMLLLYFVDASFSMFQFLLLMGFIYISVTRSLHFLYTSINALLTFVLHFIFIRIINIYKYYEIFIVNVVINAMKKYLMRHYNPSKKIFITNIYLYLLYLYLFIFIINIT